MFGAVGTAGTFGLNQINTALGTVAGVLTVTILLLRARREWKRRNDL